MTEDEENEVYKILEALKDHLWHSCGVKCANCGTECGYIDLKARGMVKQAFRILDGEE